MKKRKNSTQKSASRLSGKTADAETPLPRDGAMEVDLKTAEGVIEIKRRTPEEKREKFRELAESRVPKAAWAIRNIGKLANLYAYDFEARDIAKIVEHLRKELDEMETRFERALSRETRKFSLD
jgi:uncharacterized protein Yka (UPF0111/DUF47 family)